jgi:hypothetical protein
VTSWSARIRERKLELRRRLAARFVDDRTYVSSLYRQAFGRAPNLDRPVGFNEKILVKIVSDRRPYLTLFSDKLRVRDYVARVAPALALPALYWHDSRAESLDVAALPDAFMLKPNHGSGWLRAVPDKRAVSRDELVRLMRRWLACDFSIVGREWAYRNIEREVFAEELLRGPDGRTPADYKLFVFAGVVRLIQVDADRFTRHTQALYDESWQPIVGTVKGAQGAAVAPPTSLSTMIDAAQALSQGVDFVRVDLYEVGGKPYFGELTHYPNKGLNRFDPPSLDARLGGYLALDDYAADAISARVMALAGAAPPVSR